MAEYLTQGKQKAASLVREDFCKGRGSNLLDSILDALLGEFVTSETEEWCLWLLSGGLDPHQFLKELKSNNTSSVCGLVWNAHFVAYRCRDCAISPCMSLCADCFINGDHEGHDFNMFRSQAGGACDCGDENVMRKQGFCSNHGSNCVVKKQRLPDELSAIAQVVISRIFLKIYEDFVSGSNTGASNEAKQSVRALFSLLQKLCEADELRSYIAKTILMNVPQTAITQQRRANLATSQLRPTTSTESGHTLVHSIPGSPNSPFLVLDHEYIEPMNSDILSAAVDIGEDGSPFSYLDYLMHVLVEFEFPNFLATFMLSLLPEQTYKESFTRSFCQSYLAIGKKLSQSMNPEHLSNHIVHVSVQLFSSEALATTMVREEKLLDTLISVLIEIVGKCLHSYEYVTEGNFFSFIVANCDHRILVNHCYWPVASDLLNIFSHKYVVKTFLESDQLLNQWMDLVTLVSGMNMNTRRIYAHILFEPRTYITSFSVEFESVAAVMWEILRGCNKLRGENGLYILRVVKATELALQEWHNSVPFKPCKFKGTFHLSLHRYYALFVSQAIVAFGLDESQVLPNWEFLTHAMEYPLRALVTLSEIKAGFWVYSGAQMRGQAYSYVQCHFCNSMVDLDVLFVQMAASKLDPDYFLTVLMESFSLTPWFQFSEPVAKSPSRQDIGKETLMVESFLGVLLILLSQRVFIGSSEYDQCKKDLAALLCVSDKTHSQLSDMIPTKPGESQETSKKFEIALKEMADFKPPSLASDVMQQGTYSPKDIVWDEYFDHSHILLRFFLASEYQKASKRYSENMENRGATLHRSCFPPLKDLPELHPSFRGLYRLLHCRTMQKIIFFILYKAVYSENSISELILINTIQLFYHAMTSPLIEEKAPIAGTKIVHNKRVVAAIRLLDYLEKFGNDNLGPFENSETDCPEELAVELIRCFEDDNFCFEDESLKFNNVFASFNVENLLNMVFGENNFSVFEPMLSYMDNGIEEIIVNESVISRHLHSLRSLLSLISEERYLLLKKLAAYWRRCALRDNVRIDTYEFCKERQSRPGFSQLLVYFTEHFDWLFRIHKISPGEPATVFDINFNHGTIFDNASIPVVSTSINTTRTEDKDDNISESQDGDDENRPPVLRQQSLISILVSLMEKLRRSSKCIPTDNLSDFTRQQQNIRAGDGSFQISQLLLKLRSSNIQNQVLVDELSPKIGMNSNGCRKKNGISDDALKEKVERKKKAMARQKKILAEFMSKQEVFKEQNITSDVEFENLEKVDVEAVSTEKQYECVICRQMSSSSSSRPIGEAVLLQPTTVLATRRREGEYDELPHQQQHGGVGTCGKAMEKRKMEMLRSFAKISAGRALEVGLDCGIHIQTCGHFLHIDCHQSYFKSLQDEQIRTYIFEQPQFDITKGFFNCPFCRQPCNAVLPILPDSIRKRPHRKTSRCNNDSLLEITNLLRKYSETGSLSSLTARALEFTVLTASTTTFMEVLITTLKSETSSLASALYSDRNIKEKFLILVSTIRTCLEVEYMEINCGMKVTDDRRSCLGNLLEVCQFHAQSLEGPLLNLWRELTDDRLHATPRSNDDYDQSRIPMLLCDAASILIQFGLTWPTWITIDHFQYLVKVLFNLHVIQAFVHISLTLPYDEFKSWQQNVGKKPQDSNQYVPYEILGIVSIALSQIKMELDEDQEDAVMTGISESLLSPQAIELKVLEFCLPFLRLASSLSHVMFKTPIVGHQDQEEFLNMAINFGLAPDELFKVSRDILPTECLNWPFAEPNSVIRSWCEELQTVLRCNGGKDLAILPNIQRWSYPRLVPLPKSYDRLFQFYRKQTCRTCQKIPDHPAVCLVCGVLVCFQSSCCASRNGEYECVKHSIGCGCGTGIFLIISSSAVLIIRSERVSIWGSVYLDSFGEEDKDLKRGKPLFLSQERYKRLEQQWLTHSFDRACKKWGFHNGKL